MKIAMACDHGALDYKNMIKEMLVEMGHEVEDFGTHTKDSMDYPDTVAPAAKSVASGKNDRGIVLCSTGVGASITANKIKGVRCALISVQVVVQNLQENITIQMYWQLDSL